MSYATHQFGTLYLNGVPKHIALIPTYEGDIPAYNGNAIISIGDSWNKNIITWIQPDDMNLLIADRVLLSVVKWSDLNQQGFVDGKEISIDGMRFRCRLLKVGDNANAPNEWDDILDITGEDDDLWHWKDMYFWGQEVSTHGPSTRAVRGYPSARFWGLSAATSRGVGVGFRPALEPLDTDTLPTGRAVTLEGFEFNVAAEPTFIPISKKNDTADFRPLLIPRLSNLFEGIAPGTKINMYTLLMDGKPVKPNGRAKYRKGAIISMTDAFFGTEYLIPWVVRKRPDNVVCTYTAKPLIVGIPKDELKKQGYLT